MNRRNFLRRATGAAALTLALGWTKAAARPEHSDLSQEVARFKASKGYTGDYDHDYDLDQRYLAQGLSMGTIFAGLKGDVLSPEQQAKATAACLTNRRLRQMIYRFQDKHGQSHRELDDQLRLLHAQSGQYLTRLRAYYGLDHASGWIDRELA